MIDDHFNLTEDKGYKDTQFQKLLVHVVLWISMIIFIYLYCDYFEIIVLVPVHCYITQKVFIFCWKLLLLNKYIIDMLPINTSWLGIKLFSTYLLYSNVFFTSMLWNTNPPHKIMKWAHHIIDATIKELYMYIKRIAHLLLQWSIYLFWWSLQKQHKQNSHNILY